MTVSCKVDSVTACVLKSRLLTSWCSWIGYFGIHALGTKFSIMFILGGDLLKAGICVIFPRFMSPNFL